MNEREIVTELAELLEEREYAVGELDGITAELENTKEVDTSERAFHTSRDYSHISISLLGRSHIFNSIDVIRALLPDVYKEMYMEFLMKCEKTNALRKLQLLEDQKRLRTRISEIDARLPDIRTKLKDTIENMLPGCLNEALKEVPRV